MKKTVITFTITLFGMGLFAQKMTSTDSIKAVVSSWKSALRSTRNVKRVVLNYSDPALCPIKAADETINYKTFEAWGQANQTLRPYYDETEKALKLDYNWENSGFGFANWGDYLYNYWITKQTSNVAGFNPFYNSDEWKAKPSELKDSVVGVTLNLTDTINRIVKVEYKIVGLNVGDSANLRMDLLDVNGRSTGGHSAKRIIGGTTLPNDGQWHTATFYWNASKDWANLDSEVGYQGYGDASLNDAAQQSFSDEYDATWFTVANGRGWGSSSPEAPSGLFGFIPNSKIGIENSNSPFMGDKYAIPVDAANIAGFKFIINDGPSVAYHDKKFSLLVKSISIGNQSATGDDLYNPSYVFADISSVTLNKSNKSKIIQLKDYYSIAGAVFSFEQQANSKLNVTQTDGLLTITSNDICGVFNEDIIVKAIANGKEVSTKISVFQIEPITSTLEFKTIPNQIITGNTPVVSFDITPFLSNKSSNQVITYSVKNDEASASINLTNENVIEASITNPLWIGSVVATVSAKDQCGQIVSTNVIYSKSIAQTAPTTSELSSGSLTVSKSMVEKNESIQLYPSLINTTNVYWEMEGANQTTSTLISPVIKYSKPGLYKIVLNAFHYKDILKIEKTIKVIGIDKNTTQTCIGKTYTFTVNDNTMQYKWSDGSTLQSISVSPTEAVSYYVTATKDGKSFLDSVTIKNIQVVHADPLCLATIDETGSKVLLAWERTANKGTLKYNIYREGFTNIYTKIGETKFESIGIFVDSSAFVNKRAYRYKMTTTDTCGVETPVESSNSHKTIHLQKVIGNNELQLSWTLYEGADILGYKLLEGLDESSMKELDEFGTDQTSYTITNPGNNKYRVVSVFAKTIDPSKLKSDAKTFSESLSNYANVSETSSKIVENDLYIVAIPNPSNGTFKCLVKNEKCSDFKLAIYNSIGDVIVEKQYENHSSIEDVFSLAPGQYYIKAISDSGVKCLSVIVY